MGGTQKVTRGLVRIPLGIVNAYFIGEPGEPWVLVDAGLPGTAPRLHKEAAAYYGGRPPEAIVLTHGHFDHTGGARTLAERWGVPVYAHRLELPYLTGRSDYPPPDPTVGGGGSQLSRLYPKKGTDLSRWVRPLPEDGSVPGAPGWRWLHTPGHTAGHVSLFREADRTLVSGDALITTNQDSFIFMLTKKRELHRPPSYFTPDWEAARRSVETLARLRPQVLAAGHGVPMAGAWLPDAVARFSQSFEPPRHGRYVPEPARADAQGVVYVPPPSFDPLPVVAGVVLVGLGVALLARRGVR